MNDDIEKRHENQQTKEDSDVVLETVEVDDNGEYQKQEELIAEEVVPTAHVPQEVSPMPKVGDVAPPAAPIPQESVASLLLARSQKFLVNYGKFVVGGALVLIVIAVLATVYGPKPQIQLVWWGVTQDATTMAPVLAEYKKKRPNVTVHYIKMTPDTYRMKLVGRTQESQSPDIYSFHNTWLPQLAQVATPVPQNIISNEEYEKIFYKVAQKDLKVGKFYYGIPLEVDGLVLVYNEELFKKGGVEPTLNSWDDVVTAASRLTVRSGDGNIVSSGIALGTASNVDHFSNIFGLFLVQNGASLDKLESVEAAGALESYTSFARGGEAIWNESQIPSVQAFARERVAMIIVPSWEVNTIKSLNPQIKLKVTAVPVVPGNPPVSVTSYWVEGVARASQNQKEAWELLKFMVQKESLKARFEEVSKTRTFGPPYPRQDMAEDMSSNEYAGVVVAQANSLVSLPLIDRTYDEGLNDEIIVHLKNAINAVLDGTAVAEALAPASAGIRSVYEKYGL